MKTLSLHLVSLLIMLVPVVATAQNNIRSAFDAIINCQDAVTSQSHTLDKDPVTGIKSSQSDVYCFELPASRFKLVKNVLSAFDKDTDMAYSINSGKAENPNETQIQLAVGDATSNNVRINDLGYDYIYALFLAPKSEDPDGIHRYAYGINYAEENGRIVGKLVRTYATTLKHRQEAEQKRSASIFSDQGSQFISFGPAQQQSWFEAVVSCLNTMKTRGTDTRIALATKAYKLIKNSSQYPEVTESEKETVREIIKAMITDKKYYSEPILERILNQCLVSLK